MIRNRAAAVRNDEPQRREILEQVAVEELHERRGVRIDVMRCRWRETPDCTKPLTCTIAGTSSSTIFS